MTGNKSLDTIRQEITELDQQLLGLLARRRELSLEVAQSKVRDPHPIRDQAREEALLVRLIEQGRSLGLDAHYVTQLYHTIIEDSVLTQQANLQKQINPDSQQSIYRVAFLGDKGSYSYLAMRKYFSRYADELVEIGCSGFKEIIGSVENGQADYAVLPIENTSSGSINEVFDVLQHTRCSIVGELTLPIEHCLLAAVPTQESQITTIYTHFQPAAQCSEYLNTQSGVKVERCDSTSSAFLKVSELKDPHVAAIGSASGGALYGLSPIRHKLANQKENFSRFIVVARNAVDVAEQIPAKTTLIMSTAQKPGALVEALLVLRDLGLNLSKLESRPIMGNPWEEMFYMDIEANVRSAAMVEAMKTLTRITRYVKVLGCYPSEDVMPTQIPAEKLPRAEATSTAAETDNQELQAGDSKVQIDDIVIGNGQFVTLAGPHGPISADSLAHYGYLQREQGAHLLQIDIEQCEDRCGVLRAVEQVSAQYQLPAVIEIRDEHQLDQVLRSAAAIAVNERSMQRRALLLALGRQHKPVILRRDPTCSIDELIAAAEIILAEGNQQVILCEGGVRTIDSRIGLTLDLSAIPLLKSRTHLPVLVAPCRAAEQATQIAPLVEAARAVGAQGVWLALGQPSGDGVPLDDNAFSALMKTIYG